MYLMITGFPLPVIVLNGRGEYCPNSLLRLFCSDLPSQMLDDLKFLISSDGKSNHTTRYSFSVAKLFTWLVLNSNYFTCLRYDI